MDDDAHARKRLLALYRWCGSAAWRSSSSGSRSSTPTCVRPGGWPQVGAIVAIMGVIDAMFAPRLLKTRLGRAGPRRASEALLEGRRGRAGGRRLGDPARRPAGEDAGAGGAGRADRGAGRGDRRGMARRSKTTIDPRAMPLTGLANAAIDRVAPDRQAFAGGLARYAEADLACYRAERPARAGRAAGAAAGTRCSAWARRRYDVDFATTSGLMHVAAAAGDGRAAGHAVAALDPFRLAGLSPLVTIGGSLVAALAVLEKAMTPEAGVGGGQHRRALAARAMGRGRGGRGGAGEPPPRFPGRGAVPRAARRLVLRADQVADEGDAGRSGGRASSRSAATIARTSRQALVHVVVDQHIFIFGPVADLVGGALHPVGDDLFAVGAALVQAALELGHRRRQEEDR